MIAVGAFILGGLVVAAADNFGGHHRGDFAHKDHKMGMMGESSSKRMDYDEGKNKGMMGDDMGMGNMHDMHMMVESEKDFLLAMIPHHEEAIITAKEVVERGGSTPEIKTLAENIITAQEKEVADMKTWYKNWYGTDYVADGTYKPMMQSQSELSGVALDKVFLSGMVMHHMGAIMMAESVVPHIEHGEMKTLTDNIKRTQSEEIKTMQEILKGL